MRIFDFPQERVSYVVDFPAHTVKKKELKLTALHEEPPRDVVFQLSDAVEEDGFLRKATVHFRADLPRGAERRFRLQHCPGETQAPFPKQAGVSDVAGNEAVLLANLLRVKVPYGRREFAEGKPLSEIPAPILALACGPEGGEWKGAGRFEAPEAVRVLSIEAGPLVEGPLFARYRVSYRLQGGKTYTANLTTQYGETHALIDENLQGFSPEDEAYLRFDFLPGIDPDQRWVMNNGGYEAAHQTVGFSYTGAFDKELEPGGRLPFELGLYHPNSLGVMRAASFLKEDGDCALMFVIDRLREWKTARRLIWRERAVPGFLNFFHRDGAKYMRARLEGGERHWAISLIPRNEWQLAPGAEHKRKGKNDTLRAGPEIRLFQKLTEFSLDRVKDLEFDWPESTERRLPPEFSRERSFRAEEGASAAADDAPISCEEWLARYGLEGKQPFLRCLVSAFWDYSGNVGPVSFRAMPRWFGDYDRSRATWTEEQRRHIRSLLVFMAASSEDDVNLPHHSMLAGHPNFINDVKQVLPLACAVFPDHPRARQWRDSFMGYFDEFLDAYQRKDDPQHNAIGGRWTENIACYSGTALIALLHEHEALQRFDGTDLLADPRVHAWIRWYRDSMMSPHDGVRLVPPEGAHATSFDPDSVQGHYKTLFEGARRMANSAPQLSRQMRWIETNGREGERPPVESVLIRDYGPVMRHDFGGPNEAYAHLLQIAGPWNYRWGEGGGVLYYGAKGKVWSFNGREHNGDEFDINKVTGFSVGGKGLGRHPTDQPLYDFGFAQFYRALGTAGPADAAGHEKTAGGAPAYLSRGIMMLRDDYIALYDDVEGEAEGQFVWVNAWDLPQLCQIKPGAPFETEEYRDEPRESKLYEGRTLRAARCRGRGDFLTLVSPQPLKARTAPFGAVVNDSEFILCNDRPLDLRDERLHFRGTAGYARPGQLALFEGDLLGLDGFEIRREGGEFGFSAAAGDGRITGRIVGRAGGLISIVPPSGFKVQNAKISLAGSPLEARVENGAVSFDVEIAQRDGCKAYEITF